MADQRIVLPDGRAFFFPADMPDEEIDRNLQATLTQEQIARETPQQEQPQRSMTQMNYTQPPARRMEGLPAAPDAVPPTPNTLPWYVPEGNALRTIVRGTGRGIAGILDLPARGVDWTARNVFDYTPPGTNTPFTDVFDAYAPAPVQGYERMHENAETYGPSVIAAPVGGATSLIGRGLSYGVGVLGNAASTVLGQAAGTIGEKVGSTVGGWIGEKLGDRERGEQLGGDVGSTGLAVATPTIAARSGERSIRRQLTDADTPGKLQALRENRITPTLDLIGNEKARTIADAARRVPIIGSPAKEMRNQQLAEVNRAGQEIAAEVRGGPSAPPVPVPIPPGSVGTIGGHGNLFGSRGRSLARQRANAAAVQAARQPPGTPATGPITKSSVSREGQGAVDTAIARNTGTISNIGEAIDNVLVGRDTVGPSRNIDAAVAAIAAETGRGPSNIATLQERAQPLLSARRHPIDPQLDIALGAKRALLEKRLQEGIKDPVRRKSMEDELADTMKKIDENTGSTYGALKDERGNLSQDILGKPSVDTHLAGRVKDATTESMAGIAERQGMPRADWDEMQNTMTERYRENEYLEQAKAKREGGQGFNKLFNKDNEHDVKMRQIIEQRAPAELRKALADHLELKTRGKGSAGRPEITAQEMQGKISDWWNELDAENKAVITGRDPDLVRRMDALARTDELIKGPKTLSSSNLGAGSGPNMIPNAASRSLGAVLSGHVSGILPAITPVLLAGATRKLSDPNFAARIAGPPRSIVDIFDPKKTALWAHGAEPGETERRKEPLRFTVRARPQ